MSRASAVVDRMTVVSRRVLGAPRLPLAAGGLFGLLATVEVVGRGDGSPARLTTALLLGLAATVPLAFAHVLVLPAAVMVTAATLLTLASGDRLTAAGAAAQFVVLYLLGRHRSWWALALLALPFVAYAIPFDSGPADAGGASGDPRAPLVLLSLAAAAGLGIARRARGEAVARDASRRAVEDTLLEHAARGERARIARELHDVVAHHISMISVQAEAARLTTPGMPAEGARRLAAIGDTARTALTEMQRLLGVLRSDARAEPTRAPQPGLEQLIELIDEAREAGGGSTRLIVRGRVVPLGAGVELTAYRIVQEALTNARRHAPGAAVDVELDYDPGSLRLRVRDNGPGPPGDAASGHGLLGMRERAAMVGGTLSAGPARLGGFLVEALLPAAEPAA